MPNCFTLTRKGDDAPSKLADVDEDICKAIGEPVHPDLYVLHWYDSIGLMLAMGKTWDEQREIYARHPRLLEIIDHLEANYETDAWYSVR